MVHAGIEGGNVGKTHLGQSLLEDGDAGRVGSIGARSVVDGADYFVDVRRDEGIYQC